MPSFKKNQNLLEEIKKAVQPYVKPALHLIASDNKSVFSKIGSRPEVPKEFQWPTWNGQSLAFVLQLKFSEINGSGYLPHLPTAGLLYVFYDPSQSTWGFDPKDEGSWRLLFFEETDVLESAPYPNDLELHYQQKHIKAKPIDTYPPIDAEIIDTLFEGDEGKEEAYEEFRSQVYEKRPWHQLGGYSDPIQNYNMDLECQLVSNGLYCGDKSGYEDQRAEYLAKNQSDWILLLQIDSDDEAEMCWCDCGRLYFWIKKNDLAAGNFDDVWMILQCY
ncbi:MAG: DUF1963 domain-containing protein [Deltaproteobacteria bacterium]|jgi:uncharacterized protein YwqG|nr:DUF1963 domain-containing protein [Deltaproteobacteria bacterium]